MPSFRLFLQKIDEMRFLPLIINLIIISIISITCAILFYKAVYVVDVRFCIEVDRRDNVYQLYYSQEYAGFSHPNLIEGHHAGLGCVPVKHRFYSVLPFDSFRLDPAKRKDVRFRISNLEVRNFYGDIERFDASDLIRSRRGVQQIIEVENNVFISNGSDPFFTVSLPKTFYKTDASNQRLFLFYFWIAGLAAFILWRVLGYIDSR